MASLAEEERKVAVGTGTAEVRLAADLGTTLALGTLDARETGYPGAATVT
jgi:hypothetical protein